MKAKGEAIKRNCNVVVQFESKSCFIFVDNGRMSGVAKDNIWQPGEEVILRYHYRDDVCATTNFPADRIRFKSGYGLRPGTITLYANGTVCGKIVLNMVGRVRIEKS